MPFVYRIDDAHWPLAIFESPGPRHASEIDSDSFYAELERLLKRRERFATMHDLRGTRPDANRRRRFAEWVRDNEAELRLRLAAHAVVVDTGFQRGMITAVLWMAQQPCPMKVFTDRDDAERWLRSVIAESGRSR